ncbi:unnamed protein product [Blepharisma stoltei]|uniref:Uncharacterized protein n=1 Tax=Blepharisma stoltei TaxID=1481888 RepID=A0AAU9JHV0_9CILI|nr:unnamed protein product [Blepharisma stoltei]
MYFYENPSPKISSKIIEFPFSQTIASKALRGSYIKSFSAKPTQRILTPYKEKNSKSPPKNLLKPNKQIYLPSTKRQNYKPKSRLGKRLQLDETIPIYKSQVHVETPTSFLYSTRFQRNPKLVYDSTKRDYVYQDVDEINKNFIHKFKDSSFQPSPRPQTAKPVRLNSSYAHESGRSNKSPKMIRIFEF